MVSGARYVHTNLIARDWQRLARFYQDVFGCMPVPPERNLSGAEMEAGTGVPAARLRGMHMRLPHRPGFAHIAFAVDSVAAAREQVLPQGGSPVGDVVTVAVAPTARVTWCYVRDPEGNIVELQAWS